MNTKKTTSKLGLGILVGAVAGAVAGLFLAPKSGKKLRGDVLKRAEDIKRKIKDVNIEKTVMSIFDEVSDRTVEAYNEAKDMLAEKLAEVAETVSNIDSEKYTGVVNDIIAKISKKTTVAEDTLVKLRKNLEDDFKKLKTTTEKTIKNR